MSTISYDLQKIEFFGENDGRIGTLLFDTIPDPGDGSIFFEEPCSYLPLSIAATNADLALCIKYPAIRSFPEEEFSKVIKGNYVLKEDKEKNCNRTPIMILYGAKQKCVGIQVGFSLDPLLKEE